MKIEQVIPQNNCILQIVSTDGRTGFFDVTPYTNSEAFKSLKEWQEFSRVRNGGYYIEWPCGADLSADTIEVRWQKERALENSPQ
jgi:Protein of unknown function (DUF2442)